MNIEKNGTALTLLLCIGMLVYATIEKDAYHVVSALVVFIMGIITHITMEQT